MKNITSKIASYIQGAFKELPAEASALLLSALSLIVLIQIRFSNQDLVLLLFKCFALGAVTTPLVFSVSIASKHGKISGFQRISLSLLAALLVAIFLFVMTPSDPESFELVFLWSILPVGLSAFCAPFVTSALVAPKTKRFEACSHFIRSFFESVTLWGLCWCAAALAVAIVTASIVLFFQIESFSVVGPQCLVFITIFFVLSFLFKILNHPDKSIVPVFWQKISTIVGAPFVAVMLFLFLLYETTLLIKGELPQNMLSPLIIGCGVVGFLCTLIFQSIELTPQNGNSSLYSSNRNLWLTKPTIRIARAFPFLLALLLPMAIWAVCVRINEYGFTPFRIMRVWTLVFLGGASILGGYRWLSKKHPLSWEFPLLLGVFALLFAIGPFNARRLSLDSQTKRLRAEFAALKLTPFVQNDMPKKKLRVPWEKFDEISDILELVLKLGGKDHIALLFDGDIEKCQELYSSGNCLHHIGLASEPYNGFSYRASNAEPDAKTFDTRELTYSGPSKTGLGTISPFELYTHTIGLKVDGFEIGVEDKLLILKRDEDIVGTLSLIAAGICDELPTHSLRFETGHVADFQAEVVLSDVQMNVDTETQACSLTLLRGYLLTMNGQDSSPP